MVTPKWVPVPGHPDYAVNNYGEVMNLRTAKIVRPTTNDGYFRIRLDGVRYYVQKVVMMSFYPDEDSNRRIRHINGDSGDNCLWNLEYVTEPKRRRTVIVRCRFCKHREYCENPKREFDDFYCADGEFK